MYIDEAPTAGSDRALEWPLSGVNALVNIQGTLLNKRLVATLEGTKESFFVGVYLEMPLQTCSSPKLLLIKSAVNQYKVRGVWGY